MSVFIFPVDGVGLEEASDIKMRRNSARFLRQPRHHHPLDRLKQIVWTFIVNIVEAGILTCKQADCPVESDAGLVYPFNEIQGALGFTGSGQWSEMSPRVHYTAISDNRGP